MAVLLKDPIIFNKQLVVQQVVSVLGSLLDIVNIHIVHGFFEENLASRIIYFLFVLVVTTITPEPVSTFFKTQLPNKMLLLIPLLQ